MRLVGKSCHGGVAVWRTLELPKKGLWVKWVIEVEKWPFLSIVIVEVASR